MPQAVHRRFGKHGVFPRRHPVSQRFTRIDLRTELFFIKLLNLALRHLVMDHRHAAKKHVGLHHLMRFAVVILVVMRQSGVTGPIAIDRGVLHPQ